MSATTLQNLLNKSCQPLAEGTSSLSENKAKELLMLLPEWDISTDGKCISRNYKFKNYYHTTAFVNASSWISHQQDHHPDIHFSYNQCRITYSTHSVEGLSDNDFICAAKTDHLL